MTTAQVFRNTLVVLATIASAYVILMSARILVVLLIAIFIASAVRPMVLRLMRWRFSEGLSISLVYAVMIIAILVLTVLVIPPIINQLADYLQNESRLAGRIIAAQRWIENTLSNLTGNTVTLASPEQINASVGDFVEGARASLLGEAAHIGGLLGEAILVFIMGLYWLTSRDKAVAFLSQLVTPRYRDTAREISEEIESSVGAYIAGIVGVALFVGVANFLLLTLFRVPNASTYAFIVGSTTMLPIVGGFIGGGLAALLALLTSPVNGLIVFGTFVAVQQIENHYLTPRTMARSVGIDPLLVMVGVFAGFSLGGVTGALIAVPILGAISILFRHMFVEPRKAEVEYKIEQGAVIINADPLPTEPPPVIVVPSSNA
jgi:predicted PurR-regulated permease PerM